MPSTRRRRDQCTSDDRRHRAAKVGMVCSSTCRRMPVECAGGRTVMAMLGCNQWMCAMVLDLTAMTHFGVLRRWRFFLHELHNGHWVSVARGPPEVIVDAWGVGEVRSCMLCKPGFPIA